MRFDKRSVVKVGDVVEFLDEDREGNYYSKQGEYYTVLRVERAEYYSLAMVYAQPINPKLRNIECYITRFGTIESVTTIDDWL